MTPQQHRVEVLPTSDLLIILVCGGDGHPAVCSAALELIERVREGCDDAKDGLVELAENRSLVAQAALLELGVEQCVQEAELLNADDASPVESLLPNDSPSVESPPDDPPSGSRSRSDDSESGRSNGGCSRSRSPRRRMVQELSA